MDTIGYVTNYLSESIRVKKALLHDQELIEKIGRVSDLITHRYQEGRKVILAGNGGSAADSQHIAAEFVSRFFFDRPGLPALALTTDTSMITAIGNDYGFENIFSRQVQAQGVEGDVFIGISTSGNSKNIIRAFEEAQKKNITTIALCGNGGVLGGLADFAINVPSDSTPYIQECHICIGHIICALVEENIFGGK
jgi:D-sedoheptulose 7-phosphate isomerase